MPEMHLVSVILELVLPRSRAPVVLLSTFVMIGSAIAGESASAHGATAAPVPAVSADTITIDPVTSVTAGNHNGQAGEILSVTATSTSALTSMTVHLHGTASDRDVLTLTMRPPASPPASGQTSWTSPVIDQASLPLGIYDIAVDAADQGTAVRGRPAGTFAFQDTPSIAPDPANLVISYTNQAPVISGRITTRAPGGTTPRPYHGQVVLSDSVRGNVPLTTNARTGGYSYTFRRPEPGETFRVVVPASSTLGGAATATARFGGRTDPVALSASLSASAVTYGGAVTAEGTVSYQPGGGAYVPLSRQTVRVYDQPGAAKPVVTAVTDARGHFTARLPGEAASVRWVVRAGGPAASPYLDAASVTLPMTVNLPATVSGFEVALSQLWRLSFRGCLTLPSGVPGSVPALSGLTIQYASAPDGPWRTLGAVPQRNSTPCAGGHGLAFAGTLGARLNYAYYRAWYPGATVAGTGYLPSVSGAVVTWKYVDRITGFGVSSSSLREGGKLTVSGRLQYYAGTWRDYAGQRLYIVLRPKGDGTWYYMPPAVRTDAAGRFSLTFTDPRSATWSAVFYGNSAHMDTAAPLGYVTVG